MLQHNFGKIERLILYAIAAAVKTKNRVAARMTTEEIIKFVISPVDRRLARVERTLLALKLTSVLIDGAAVDELVAQVAAYRGRIFVDMLAVRSAKKFLAIHEKSVLMVYKSLK